MSKVLEQLIARGRRERKPTEQRDVAFSLAEISTNAELHEKMVSKGVVKALLTLILQSSDPEALRLACLCMANVASCPASRVRIVEDGVLPPLVKFFKDEENENDAVAKQYVAMTIGNLAAEPENHEEIVQLGTIEPLVKLLDPEIVHSGVYCAFALANLSVNNEYRPQIVEEGAIPRLIALACCKELSAQRQSLACLRGICISPGNRVVVVKEGMLDPLVLMARSDEPDIQREVAAAFCALSATPENKVEISDRALLTIISLSLSGDPAVEEYACSTIANLTELHELHDKLLRENGLASIMALAVARDLNTRSEACRCLANLTANEEVQSALMKEGVLQPLAAALVLNHHVCQRYAALALANLSTTASYQVQIVGLGTITPLIALAQAFNRELEARRYAVLAIANLAAMKANHPALVEAGCLLSLFSLASTADALSQYYVAFALANFASNEQNHTRMVEEGGLQPIITLASSEDTDVHHQAVAALRGLGVSEANKVKILQEGGLEPLVLLLQSDDLEILRETCAALCNLSVSEETKYEIAKSGAVAPLIAHSQSEDMELARQSCATLANLAEVEENQEKICADGGVPPLIAMMRSQFVEVQREAGRALGNLSAFQLNHEDIIEHGGHQLLISYLLSPDMASQRVGALGICNLATNPAIRELLMESGAMEPLMSLARSEDVELEIQRFAILAIANLATCVENHRAIVEEGSLPLLISLSSAPDEEVRQYAAFALVKVALNADLRKQITEEGGLEPVLFLARTQSSDLQADVLPAICTLSFADANKSDICKCGGLPPILSALKNADVGVQRQALCAVANLAEDVENQSHLVANGAIPPVVEALQHGGIIAQREAARALGNLSANCDFAEVVLRQGAAPPLIQLLGSEVVDCQRMAAMALCNLGTNVNNQPKLLTQGVLPPVLARIEEALDPRSLADNDVIRYCLLVLANLAVSPSTHEQLLDKALTFLAGYAKHRDVKCRQFAIFAVGNLCSNPNNIERIVAANCLQPIISFAFPGDANVQFQAIAGLRGLSVNQAVRQQVVRLGALEPLILAASSESIEVQREVAATLSNLSLSEENKITMARGGCLPALIALASSRDSYRERQAVCALANLAEMIEGHTHKKMLEEGVLTPLYALATGADLEVKRQVSRCLALFAAKPSSQATLLRSNALRYISASAQETEDAVCRRFGTLAIGNLAVDHKNHRDLFDQGAVTALMTVDKATDLETRRALAFALNNLAANESNSAQISKLGVLRTVIALIHDADEDTHLQACFALRRMVVEAKNRTQAVSFGALPPLFKLALSESVEVQREVCAALRNLSLSEDNKVVIVLNGGLAPLLTLVHSADGEVAHQACGVLANLAEVVENQGRMVKDGVLQYIKFVLRAKSVDVQREALRTIANMSAEYAYTAEIVSAGGLAPLMAALNAPDFLSQRYAAMGIANLSTNVENITKIVQDALVPTLVALASGSLNGDLDTQRYAVFTLTNIASVRATQSVLVDAGVLPLFAELLQHADMALRNGAAFGLANFTAFSENHAVLLELGDAFLEALLRLLESQDSKCQYRAVCALRGLCVNELARRELVRRGVLRPLLALTKSEDMDVQQEVLACLCNLSLSGCVGAYPEVFIAACEMQSLVAFLCSADATYRLFGAVTLGNIAAKTEYQDELVAAGAVSPLVEVANSVDLETHRCIAFALCNLAANPDRRQMVEAMGGLPPIIQLACSDDVNDQKTAIAALRGLSNRPETRLHIVSEGGLEPLVLGARSSDVQLHREVTMTAYNLSLAEKNKLAIASSPLMGALITLMLSNDEDTAAFASASVANIAENSDTHAAIAEQRGLRFFLEFETQGAPARVAREAVKCVANLSSNYALHDLLLADGCHEFLVRAIQHADPKTRLFSVVGLGNLVSNPQNHSRVLREKVVMPLIELAVDIDHPEPRQYALLALGCIFTNEENHVPFVDNGVLPALIAELDAVNDMETRFYAAFALGKISTNESLHELIGQLSNSGGPLIKLALDAEEANHPSAQCHAVSVLRRITNLDVNRVSMVAQHREELAAALLACARHTELLENQREAAACLCNLSLAQSNKLIVASSPALFQQLFALCSSPDVEVARNACGAAANIAENVRTHEYMIDVQAVHVGVKAMRSRHLPVYREASRLVANLMSTPEFHAVLLNEEGLAAVARVAKIEDQECQYNTALALHKLTSNSDTHRALLGSGSVQTLHMLLGAPGLDVQRQAAAALKTLTANKDNKPTLAEDGGTMLALTSLLRSADATLKTMGAAGVRHLSLYAPVKTQFVHEGGLPPLFSCCAVEDDDVRLQCAGAMATLSENVLNQVQMAREGALPALLELTKASYHAEIARNISRSFANLSSNPENHLGVFSLQEFRAVFTLAQSAEEFCGRDAAMCLGNLAVTSHNQFQISELGGLVPLSDLLKSEFASTRQYATRAFYRLSAHTENQHRIVDAGALPALVARLCEIGDQEIQRCAAMSICNLSSNSSNEQKIMKAGAMRALVALLRSPSVECSKYAAMALCNLTANPANQLHLVVQDDGLDPLVDLAGSSDPECSRYASMTLANVSAHRQNRLIVVERHALRPLRALCLSPNLECQRSAALALYNVSCAQANQLKLVEAGIELALVRLAGAKDGDCKRYATMTLCNLAANSETRSAAARGGGLQALLLAAKDAADPSVRRYACIALCNLACDPLLQVQVLVHGGLAPVLALTEDGDDLESQRFAIMALSNLAANENNHDHMINRGVLKVALRLGQSKDEDIRLYAAFALANFAGNTAQCAAIGDEGGIAALIMLAHAEDSNSHTLAVSALRRLCQFSAQNRGRIVRGGGLPPLAIAGMSEELETQREVAATYCNLSLSDEYKVEIVEQGALRPLIKLAQSPDLEVARQACGALANLAEHLDTHSHFVAERSGDFLIALMKHRNEEIHREASRTIANLLSSFEHHIDMIADGLPGLVHLGLSLDPECQYNAALALRKLAPNFASHRGLVYEGGLKTLFFLLHAKELNTRRQSVLALRDLAANSEFRRKYVEEGGLNSLITFLRDVDASLQAPAVAALRHLTSSASHPEIKQQVVDEGALRPVLRCLNTNPGAKGLRDLQCQCAGLVANLSENLTNQQKIVAEGLTSALVALAKVAQDSAEILQDVSRALANLCSNEENHQAVYKQGALLSLIQLTESADDITQRYAAMGLRFLSANPTIRVHIVQESLLQPFIKLAQSPLIDYQRTAAAAFSSFSLNEENKLKLVRDGGLAQILRCCAYEDLEVKRDCVFALANVADSLEHQLDVVREGAISAMINVGAHDDARVQRDCARVFASLSITNSIKSELVRQGALPSLFRLTRSLDVATQRFATLAICNVASSGDDKAFIVEQGAVRPLTHLIRFPDAQIQRYAALALAALALGGMGNNKLRLIEEGAVPPLIDLLRYPSADVQLCGCLALNALALGKQSVTKVSVMQSGGLLPLLALLASTDEECVRCALYCLGSLAESKDVLQKLVELGTLAHVIALTKCIDTETLRNCGYILALVVEQQTDYHDDLYREGGLDAAIALACVEDMECQEYATFTLAHLASNREYQVRLVERGALRPLIAMMSVHAEPRHYAGLALLKLADNYENHLRIAEEGGIQALLRIARARSTDEELQYKASLSLGQLASNATRSLPNHTTLKTGDAVIGTSVNKMAQITQTVAAKKAAKDKTTQYLDDKIARESIKTRMVGTLIRTAKGVPRYPPWLQKALKVKDETEQFWVKQQQVVEANKQKQQRPKSRAPDQAAASKQAEESYTKIESFVNVWVSIAADDAQAVKMFLEEDRRRFFLRKDYVRNASKSVEGGGGGESLLHEASYLGSLKVVRFLVTFMQTHFTPEICVDAVNAVDTHYSLTTPMLAACRNSLGAIANRVEILKLLVEAGGDTARRDSHGDNVLHWCARTSQVLLLRYLLKHTDAVVVALPAENYKRQTPLSIAKLMIDRNRSLSTLTVHELLVGVNSTCNLRIKMLAIRRNEDLVRARDSAHVQEELASVMELSELLVPQAEKLWREAIALAERSRKGQEQQHVDAQVKAATAAAREWLETKDGKLFVKKQIPFATADIKQAVHSGKMPKPKDLKAAAKQRVQDLYVVEKELSARKSATEAFVAHRPPYPRDRVAELRHPDEGAEDGGRKQGAEKKKSSEARLAPGGRPRPAQIKLEIADLQVEINTACPPAQVAPGRQATKSPKLSGPSGFGLRPGISMSPTFSSSGKKGIQRNFVQGLGSDFQLDLHTGSAEQLEKSYDLSASGTFDAVGFQIKQTGLTRSPDRDSDGVPSTQSDRRQQHTKKHLVKLGVLGRGASGVVHKALHVPSLMLVAVKVIPVFEHEKRHQLIAELKALYNNLSTLLDAETSESTRQSVACPELVCLYDAFMNPNEGNVSIVVEYMDGGSLQDIADTGGCTSEVVLANISFRVLKGLAFLHSTHQLHRDIKPSNLLINHFGDVKVSDFGIVREMENSVAKATTFVGTLTYMSPERIASEEYSYKSDVWSFGLSIMTCALGKFPYSSRGGYWELLHMIRNEPPPRLPEGVFSDLFCDFLDKCLKKDQTERWSVKQLLKHEFIQRYCGDQAASQSSGRRTADEDAKNVEDDSKEQAEVDEIVQKVAEHYLKDAKELIKEHGYTLDDIVAWIQLLPAMQKVKLSRFAEQIGANSSLVCVKFQEAMNDLLNDIEETYFTGAKQSK
ncbi:hypothetical protein JG688_00003126 [Phytophthora aleatoria]|uniref:Protein kinase domain-containing protein n=1 Tax=Phytophthora aleatoria TaxID=2496075 RepID=A0A8J5J4W7_9STRA|nr:hypothetical protein JG688_00003126 [Phytophthora aleatoria]